jgi:YD repeat-containing protein
MTYGNASVAETDYDAAGRIAAVRNLKSDRSVLSIFTYTYDNASNRTAVAEASGDLVTWSYDEIYQLTREQRSGTNLYDASYSYDPVGNRLTKIEGGVITTSSYDVANELSVENAGGTLTTYSYDANGNTAVINAGGSLTTNAWDIENRLTVVQMPAGTLTTATYDGDGKRRRYQDNQDALLRNFLWDGENIARQTDVNNATDQSYRRALPRQFATKPHRSRMGRPGERR